MPPKAGKLIVVSTPIGNLEDISIRAINSLKASDLIACENTKHSSILLNKYEITSKRISLHKFNEASRIDSLIKALDEGKSVAYISDAGTPLISDPGARLVNKVASANHQIQIIPGPSAVTSAIAGAGLPADKFFFGGFLSTKKGARSKELEQALLREETSVFFESPHRIKSTLEILNEKSPERQLVIAREMTKKFEEFIRGTVKEIKNTFNERSPKGEFVLIISGAKLSKSFSFNTIE